MIPFKYNVNLKIDKLCLPINEYGVQAKLIVKKGDTRIKVFRSIDLPGNSLQMTVNKDVQFSFLCYYDNRTKKYSDINSSSNGDYNLHVRLKMPSQKTQKNAGWIKLNLLAQLNSRKTYDKINTKLLDYPGPNDTLVNYSIHMLDKEEVSNNDVMLELQNLGKSKIEDSMLNSEISIMSSHENTVSSKRNVAGKNNLDNSNQIPSENLIRKKAPQTTVSDRNAVGMQNALFEENDNFKPAPNITTRAGRGGLNTSKNASRNGSRNASRNNSSSNRRSNEPTITYHTNPNNPQIKPQNSNNILKGNNVLPADITSTGIEPKTYNNVLMKGISNESNQRHVLQNNETDINHTTRLPNKSSSISGTRYVQNNPLNTTTANNQVLISGGTRQSSEAPPYNYTRDSDVVHKTYQYPQISNSPGIKQAYENFHQENILRSSSTSAMKNPQVVYQQVTPINNTTTSYNNLRLSSSSQNYENANNQNILGSVVRKNQSPINTMNNQSLRTSYNNMNNNVHVSSTSNKNILSSIVKTIHEPPQLKSIVSSKDLHNADIRKSYQKKSYTTTDLNYNTNNNILEKSNEVQIEAYISGTKNSVGPIQRSYSSKILAEHNNIDKDLFYNTNNNTQQMSIGTEAKMETIPRSQSTNQNIKSLQNRIFEEPKDFAPRVPKSSGKYAHIPPRLNRTVKSMSRDYNKNNISIDYGTNHGNRIFPNSPVATTLVMNKTSSSRGGFNVLGGLNDDHKYDSPANIYSKKAQETSNDKLQHNLYTNPNSGNIVQDNKTVFFGNDPSKKNRIFDDGPKNISNRGSITPSSENMYLNTVNRLSTNSTADIQKEGHNSFKVSHSPLNTTYQQGNNEVKRILAPDFNRISHGSSSNKNYYQEPFEQKNRTSVASVNRQSIGSTQSINGVQPPMQKTVSGKQMENSGNTTTLSGTNPHNNERKRIFDENTTHSPRVINLILGDDKLVNSIDRRQPFSIDMQRDLSYNKEISSGTKIVKANSIRTSSKPLPQNNQNVYDTPFKIPANEESKKPLLVIDKTKMESPAKSSKLINKALMEPPTLLIKSPSDHVKDDKLLTNNYINENKNNQKLISVLPAKEANLNPVLAPNIVIKPDPLGNYMTEGNLQKLSPEQPSNNYAKEDSFEIISKKQKDQNNPNNLKLEESDFSGINKSQAQLYTNMINFVSMFDKFNPDENATEIKKSDESSSSSEKTIILSEKLVYKAEKDIIKDHRRFELESYLTALASSFKMTNVSLSTENIEILKNDKKFTKTQKKQSIKSRRHLDYFSMIEETIKYLKKKSISYDSIKEECIKNQLNYPDNLLPKTPLKFVLPGNVPLDTGFFDSSQNEQEINIGISFSKPESTNKNVKSSRKVTDVQTIDHPINVPEESLITDRSKNADKNIDEFYTPRGKLSEDLSEVNDFGSKKSIKTNLNLESQKLHSDAENQYEHVNLVEENQQPKQDETIHKDDAIIQDQSKNQVLESEKESPKKVYSGTEINIHSFFVEPYNNPEQQNVITVEEHNTDDDFKEREIINQKNSGKINDSIFNLSHKLDSDDLKLSISIPPPKFSTKTSSDNKKSAISFLSTKNFNQELPNRSRSVMKLQNLDLEQKFIDSVIRQTNELEANNDTKECDETSTKNLDLFEELNSNQHEINNLKIGNDDKAKHIRSLEQELIKMEQLNKSLTVDKNNFEEVWNVEKESLKRQLYGANQAKKQMEEEFAEKIVLLNSENNTRYKTEFDSQLAQTVSNYKIRIDKLSHEKNYQIDEKKHQIDENNLSMQQSRIKHNFSDLQQQNFGYINSIKTLENDINNLQESHKKLKEDYDHINKKYTNLYDKNLKEEERFEVKEIHTSDQQKNLREHINQIKSEQAEKTKWEAHYLNQYQEIKDKLREENENNFRNITNIRTENNTEKERMDKVLTATKEKSTMLESENSLLNSKIRSADNNYSEELEKNKILEENFQKDRQSYKDQVEKMSTNLSEMTQKYDNQNDEKKELEINLKILSSDNKFNQRNKIENENLGKLERRDKEIAQLKTDLVANELTIKQKELLCIEVQDEKDQQQTLVNLLYAEVKQKEDQYKEIMGVDSMFLSTINTIRKSNILTQEKNIPGIRNNDQSRITKNTFINNDFNFEVSMFDDKNAQRTNSMIMDDEVVFENDKEEQKPPKNDLKKKVNFAPVTTESLFFVSQVPHKPEEKPQVSSEDFKKLQNEIYELRKKLKDVDQQNLTEIQDDLYLTRIDNEILQEKVKLAENNMKDGRKIQEKTKKQKKELKESNKELLKEVNRLKPKVDMLSKEQEKCYRDHSPKIFQELQNITKKYIVLSENISKCKQMMENKSQNMNQFQKTRLTKILNEEGFLYQQEDK